jgi:arylsulfatase A-like enzyme
MAPQPNILVLMCDQLQGRVFEPDHPCQTPNLDALAARGIRFRRATTPNAVCSPARASLMTGLHVHNHGVLNVTHTTDPDQACLRTEHPHWAQRLREAGYRTGYFGKWHVERSFDLNRFGWDVNGCEGSELLQARREAVAAKTTPVTWALHKDYATPGYEPNLFYGVTSTPPAQRQMGIITDLALDTLDAFTQQASPWCCMVSVPEPHDPFVTGEAAFARYDVAEIPLAPNVHDEMAGRPGIYRKVGRIWQGLTDRERREAAACYYASITEIDAQFGRLLDRLEATGQLDNTFVVLTADHGELLGAHGMYCKNFSAYEEIYNIPLTLAGPGVQQGVTSDARVSSLDLWPTLLELVGAAPIDVPDSRSFTSVLRDPAGAAGDFTTAFAEYFGNRYYISYRVTWDGSWKYIHNGFDIDELYNLDEDPWEMTNLAEDPAYHDDLVRMATLMWRFVTDTGDTALLNTQYPILRLAPVGPGVLDTIE